MKRRTFLSTTGLALALAVTATSAAWAENATLKIGFVGVTSGPAAAWGISLCGSGFTECTKSGNLCAS